MPKLTPAVELAHRMRLKQHIESVPNTGGVFTRITFFSSKEDFVAQIGRQVAEGDDLEVQFCQVSWLGFEDSASDPCPEDPTVTLNYRLHFFHEFKQERSDGSNSFDTFAQMIINLRNLFLQNQDFDNGNTERKPLKQPEFIITNGESEFFRGAYGHFVNLTTKIEIS